MGLGGGFGGFLAEIEQVTRGHNIVADGLAGASNPQPNPNPHPSHTNLHKKYPKRLFFHFSTRSLPTDRRTDGPTDQRTKPLIELRVRN